MNSWTCHDPPNGGSYTSYVTQVVALVGAVVLCVYANVTQGGHMATHPTAENEWGMWYLRACSEVWRHYSRGIAELDEGKAGWLNHGVHRWCTH